MNLKQKIICIYFILLPFIDLITSLITRFTNFPVSLGVVVKGLTALFLVIYILFYSKSKYKKMSIMYLVLIALFAVGYFLTKSDIWHLSTIYYEISKAIRYIYFPIMFCGLLNIFEDFKIDNTIIQKVMLIDCLSYTVLLLLPYFTGTAFNSYSYNSVFGSNGWFYAANEIGVIMCSLLFSCTLFLDINKKWKTIFIIPVLFAIILLGTKTSYFGMLFVTFLLAVNHILKYKQKGIIIVGSLILITFALSYLSPSIHNISGLINVYDKKTEMEKDKNEENQNIPPNIDMDNNQDDNGNNKDFVLKYDSIEDLTNNPMIIKIVNVALNMRFDFFLQNYSIYIQSGLKNQFWGLSFSDRPNIHYVDVTKLIEMDFLDIFIHYGIIGFIVYFLPLVYFFYKYFKNILKLSQETHIYFLLVLLVLGISSLAGHVLAAPSVSIYLVLLMLIVMNNIDHIKNKKKS